MGHKKLQLVAGLTAATTGMLLFGPCPAFGITVIPGGDADRRGRSSSRLEAQMALKEAQMALKEEAEMALADEAQLEASRVQLLQVSAAAGERKISSSSSAPSSHTSSSSFSSPSSSLTAAAPEGGSVGQHHSDQSSGFSLVQKTKRNGASAGALIGALPAAQAAETTVMIPEEEGDFLPQDHHAVVEERHRWARGPIAREIRYPPGFGGFSGFWLSHPKKRGAGRTKTRKGGAVLTTAAPGEEEKQQQQQQQQFAPLPSQALGGGFFETGPIEGTAGVEERLRLAGEIVKSGEQRSRLTLQAFCAACVCSVVCMVLLASSKGGKPSVGGYPFGVPTQATKRTVKHGDARKEYLLRYADGSLEKGCTYIMI